MGRGWVVGFTGQVRKLLRQGGYRIFPRGTDLFGDIAHHLPTVRLRVIFDVGANTGQTTREFLTWYPTADIYCFEPVAETFRHLQATLPRHGRARGFQLALGGTTGQATMVRATVSMQSHLADPTADPGSYPEASLETVAVTTMDAFCAEAGVTHVNYLKVDTEGADLEVLNGAARMLGGHHVDLVQVEVGMNRWNTLHVPFEQLKGFLEDRDYRLFGLYEQVPEWPTGEPFLRRANAVFVAATAAR